MGDIKPVYVAPDEASALDAFDAFGDNLDKKYPKISKSCRDNWANLSTYFEYPWEIRKIIYTNNAIEGVNRQLCCDGGHNDDVDGPPPRLGAYNHAADRVL